MTLLHTTKQGEDPIMEKLDKRILRRLVRKFLKAGYIWFLLGLFVAPAFAQGVEIDETQAVRAIIGEASGEGLTGMTAVAEALRNRGHLRGVYGTNARHVDTEPRWVWEMAREAWVNSRITNLVKGASFWESVDFPEPYWAKDMIVTAQVGRHKFYKEKK